MPLIDGPITGQLELGSHRLFTSDTTARRGPWSTDGRSSRQAAN